MRYLPASRRDAGVHHFLLGLLALVLLEGSAAQVAAQDIPEVREIDLSNDTVIPPREDAGGESDAESERGPEGEASEPGTPDRNAANAAAGTPRADRSPASDTASPRRVTGEEQVVIGRAENLLRYARTASEGKVGQAELSLRPLLREGEVLEVIPGMMVTQHSGSGKANQYFLRGFNLDHGTDFAGFVDGVPINMPSHGHGQGWLDLNFVIPEILESVNYRKGPYHAAIGDFGAAGSADLRIARTLDHGLARLAAGFNNYFRAVVADSRPLGPGDLLFAVDTRLYDGPWVNPEDAQRFSTHLKYTLGDDSRGLSINVQGYFAEWDSTDQVPRNAVRAGIVDRLGTLDPTTGGESARASAYLQGWNDWDGGGRTEMLVWAAYTDLELFSNFTYFLEDPVNGDQFEQVDERISGGLSLSHVFDFKVGDLTVDNEVGFWLRNDNVPNVGLFRTRQRERLSTVRDDEVQQTNAALYYQAEFEIVEKVRPMLGLRGDVLVLDVDANNSANSGSRQDAQLSPKAGIVFGPWFDTEFYLNYGLGFHSNDARGTVITVDPATNMPARRVQPLVPANGAEIGLRTHVLDGFVSTLAFWWLQLDSELVFVGDAGATEPNRKSERIGVEWANYYRITSWLTLDADFAWTRARYIESDPADPTVGDRVPGAFESVISAGASFDFECGVFGSLRLRHFGPRPLVEDNSVRSNSTSLVNLRIGYRLDEDLDVHLDVLNVFDSKDSDIDYFFESSPTGGPGMEDIHTHPVEPFTARINLTWRFR